VGDDANPCSRTAPCKTFAGAISKTATNGEINVLDPGGYGAVTITKSITIDGSGGSLAGVLSSGTNGIIINLPNATDRVTLRNLELNGITTGLNGIRMLSAGALIVENTRIYGYVNSGIEIANTSGSAQVFLDNVRISSSAKTPAPVAPPAPPPAVPAGINVNPASGATATVHVSNSTITQNDLGLQTGAGGSIISFNNNRIVGNTVDGNPTQTIYTR
jgi:hypothetical protein